MGASALTCLFLWRGYRTTAEESESKQIMSTNSTEKTLFQIMCIKCHADHTVEAYATDYWKWKSGAFIQDVMPYLSEEERELFISGVCPTCWDKLFPVYCGDCLVPLKDCHHASMS